MDNLLIYQQKKTVNDKEIYIVTYVTRRKNYEPLITFDAIEVQSMEKGLVSVKDIETDILQNGHIAIYDIHFDTGKSEIKPESAEALKNISKYLNSNSDKKNIIVGHTDNSGNFDDNIKLSQNRAKSVANELVAK